MRETPKTDLLSRSSRLPLFALALVGAGVLVGCGGDDTSAEGGAPDPGAEVPAALRADLDATLQQAVADGITPGAALQITVGDATWTTAAGVADLSHATPMASSDRFRAGSILKIFVASAVLQAVEAGTIDLDERLTDRLPADVTDKIDGASEISVRMLLAHRSGIPEWVTDAAVQQIVADPEHVWSLDEILDQVAGQPPAFPPSQGYGYSNTNYVLLGEILTAGEGRPWRAAIRERILSPLGLDDSVLPEPGDPSCPAPCAHGYIAMGGEMADFTRVDPSMAGASGGHALVTSTADLTRMLQAVRSGELFERTATRDAMLAFQPAPDAQLHQTGYGFGVMRMEGAGFTAIGHMGGTAGYQSFMLYVPETDRYVSGFINVMGDIGAVLEPVLDRAAQP